MGVGRTLDYLAGAIHRAPKIMRQSGLEWLHTYLTANQFHEPHRRRQRVTNATYRFIIELIRHRYAKRV
jgi:UDP-N-acetyl-D-mannosaminuronic acid transferase (WecB/TagA/CpsF family)